MKPVLSIQFFLLFIGTASLGRTIEVCPTCDVRKISAAVTAASPCDTLLVKGGTYFENKIQVDKELTLIGIDRPVVDGKEDGEIFTVVANHFYIQGFVIQNVGRSYLEDRAGIRIQGVGDFTIRDNEFHEAYFAIYLQKARNGVVEGNRVYAVSNHEANAGNGIHAWYCKGLTIANNTLVGNRDGIYFEFVSNSHIYGNLSEGNIRYGLHFMFSDNNSYVHNTFRENGAGVAVMYSRHIAMQYNVFENNWGPASYGLLLKDIFDSEITRNLFRRNTVGIFMETSNRIQFTLNEFSENGWAIKMSGGNQANILTNNNFLHNTFNMSVHTSGADNIFDGNYWSDYSGYDLDRDGKGDVPHRPMNLFSYVVASTPEAMVLLRSLFVDLLNFSEKVSPVFTPENVIDRQPLMRPLPLFVTRQ